MLNIQKNNIKTITAKKIFKINSAVSNNGHPSISFMLHMFFCNLFNDHSSCFENKEDEFHTNSIDKF